MRKLFFIVTMALYSTLTFASAAMPWPGDNSTSLGSSKPIFIPVPKPTLPASPTPPTTITPPASTSSWNKVLSDGNVNLAIQHVTMSLLFNIAGQQIQSHQQNQPARPRRIYDRSHLQPTAEAIENWNKKGQASTKTTVHVQKAAAIEFTLAVAKALTVAQQETRVDTCVQVLAALVACSDEDETFWKLRDLYIDSGCEERVDNRPEFDENVCYSVPYGVTEACYLAGLGAGGAAAAECTVGMVCTAFSGSVVGSAILAAAPPVVMCAIVYTGSKFVVNLIRNYKQSNNETDELRVIRHREEKYAYDFQYALDRTLDIGTANAIPTHSLYYSMCYGFGNDLHAKVITIVDKQHKQHVFVVPDGSSKGAFQISDGSRHSESLIDPRYLVPQSTIDAIEKQLQAEKQKAQDLKDKARQDQIKAALNGVEKNLPSIKDYNKLPSNEHLLPDSFKPAYSKDGRILRDKTGAYFDVDGKKWSPDQKNQQWNLTDLTVKGSGTNCIKFRDLNPPSCTPTVDTLSAPINNSSIDPVVPDAPSDNSKMDIPTIEKPNNEVCDQSIPETDNPTILQSAQDINPNNDVIVTENTNITIEDSLSNTVSLDTPSIEESYSIDSGTSIENLELNNQVSSESLSDEIQEKTDIETILQNSSQSAMKNKSHGKKYEKSQESDKKPEDEEIPRIYVGVGYHGKKATSIKSAAPKNGQAALDQSFQVGPRTRVGVSDNEIVVFGRTLIKPQGGSEWHGYATTWDDLNKEKKGTTQNILIEQGLVNARGKIL